MGFSIAAFAMIVAVGHEKFLRVLATRPSGWDSSALEGTAAAFFHFLFVQFLALVAALAGKSLWSILPLAFARNIFGAVGFFLLVYSSTCALAASLRIFSLALRFGDLLKIERERAERENVVRADVSKPTTGANKIASVP